MRLAGSALIFSRLPLHEALQQVAALGFQYVDLAALEGWAHIDPSVMAGRVDETTERYRTACNAAQLTPVAINASVRGSLDFQAQCVDALAAVAANLGVHVLTLAPARKEEPLREDFDRFSRLVPLARAHGVTLTVETHYFMHTEDPAVALRYIEEVPDLGITLDASHYAAGPYWEQGFAELLPYVRHVHLRPAGRSWAEIQLAVGEGVIDFRGLLRDLQSAGYEGDLSVEYVDTIPGVDHAAEARRLREYIAGLL